MLRGRQTTVKIPLTRMVNIELNQPDRLLTMRVMKQSTPRRTIIVRLLSVLCVPVLASAGWLFRDDILQWTRNAPPPKPFIFEADLTRASVKDIEPIKPVEELPPVQATAPAMKAGELRKCVQEGARANNYTNIACPPGHIEMPVDDSRMSVMSGAAPMRSAPAHAPLEVRRRVYDQMVMSDDDALGLSSDPRTRR